MKRCKSYVGVACVDGTCPRLIKEEWEDGARSKKYSCKDCWLYEGCKDCALSGTEHCENSEKLK